MSERLTDEQLRKWAEHIRKDGGEVRGLEAEGYALTLEELLALRARVAKLEALLQEAQNCFLGQDLRARVDDALKDAPPGG